MPQPIKIFKATPHRQYYDQVERTPVLFKTYDYDKARTWVINHLDCSYAWTIEQVMEEHTL